MRTALIVISCVILGAVAVVAITGNDRPAPVTTGPVYASDGALLVSGRTFSDDVQKMVQSARTLTEGVAEVAQRPERVRARKASIARTISQLRAQIKAIESYRASERTLERMRTRITPAARQLARAGENFMNAIARGDRAAALAALNQYERARLKLSGADDQRADADPPPPVRATGAGAGGIA